MEDELSERIIGAAIAVHRALGPGMLESTYSRCLAYELTDQGLYVEVGKPLPIVYRNLKIENAYRIDMLVEHRVILELKAVEHIERVHISQLITYLKLSNLSVGLLLNFNVSIMKDGIRRIYNNATHSPSLLRSL